MATSVVLSSVGTHPAIAWSPARGRFVSIWQNGAAAYTDLDTAPLVQLGGSEGSFPRIHTTPDGATWVCYRLGAAPWTGYLARLSDVANRFDGVPFNLGPTHGSFPAVFGGSWFAYQSDGANAGWPVMRASLVNNAPASMVRHGAGVGLGLIDTVAAVYTWDDLRGLIPGLHDPTSAGGLVCGATDRNGKPCVVVSHRATGDELELWPGQDSQNPFIAWDGGDQYAVVAWSAAGQGVRRMTFARSELKPVAPLPVREPVVAHPSEPRAMAWFFDHGRYGDFWPVCHGTMCGLELYKDGSGQAPADAPARMKSAAERSGGCYLDHRDIVLAKSWWKQVIAVYLHEVGTPSDVGWAASTARSTMQREGLPVRPVIAVVSPNDALNGAFAGTCDAIAAEIYFDAPSASWDEMRVRTKNRIANVLWAQQPTPVYLIPQSYDRSDGAGPLFGPWESPAGRDQLTAIAQGCFDSLTGSRVLGLLPFAYARPGGATTYPELDRWYSAQALALVRPPLPEDEEYEDDMTGQEVIDRVKTVTIPPDISDGAVNWFRANACWERDRVFETDSNGQPTSTPTLSRGAFSIYFNPVYYREMEAKIAEFGQPTGSEQEVYNTWGDWSFQAVNKAKDAYRAAQPPGPNDPQ